MEPEDCYTIGEICNLDHINDSSVWAHIRKYSIPSRQIGNYVYVPKEEIDNLYKSEVEQTEYEESIIEHQGDRKAAQVCSP